ncbi:MAG: transposase [bacterium]
MRDEQFRLEKISTIRDPLAQLNKFIRWEDFRPIIDQAFPVTDPSIGGRPPFERVMMFKVLLLQRMYNLSIDASIVETPRQRNSRDENKQVHEGDIPEGWKSNPNKLRQKDTDAGLPLW